ncbi:MAG: RraA family protein [Desulfomonile tiedjei]|uniref:Putative 4-hydroxy-4-methyl-2-oxoglutarate aldolase n=1 Tax=Desulfomonile tiedjei TaxID=2358 RepID=A0A9D6Z289_9BACT|nr:RraA family protein [Desulfomonile tiedjei]
MDAQSVSAVVAQLTTPLMADACLRLGVAVRLAPPGIRPVKPGMLVTGRALPVRHYGSVDVFLEAFENSQQGDVLVIDNEGRLDEGCIGDLTVLEAKSAGLAGMVVWGCHRDTAEILDIGFSVFTYGSWSAGPLRLDHRQAGALESAHFGNHLITKGDFLFGDDDGVLFVPLDQIEQIVATALSIQERERQQAAKIRAGTSLREQLQFADYLAKREADPSYSFRKHLRSVGGAIEE